MKTYKNDDKKNFIDKDGLSEPILVLNRGYGKGSYDLNYCLININKDAYICNKCNKNLGYKDYLYYNGEKKYIISEKYLHNVKEHNYAINELLEKIL